MIIMILAIIIGVVFTKLVILKDIRTDGFMDWLLIVLIGSLIGLMVGLLINVVGSCIIQNFVDIKYVETTSTEIYALKDKSSTSGSFFLGSGTVDEKLKYTYILKEEDGVVVESIDSNSVIVVENDDIKPHISTFEPKYKNEVLGYFFWVMLMPKTKIYIPKNSIKYDYNIDLQ